MSDDRPRPRAGRRLALAGLVALLALGGCGKGKYVGLMPANQRPELELTQVPASTTQPYFYAYEIRWAGFDADGVVDHYLYCVDPPTTAGTDTPWSRPPRTGRRSCSAPTRWIRRPRAPGTPTTPSS